MVMTPKQRVMEAVNHREPDRIPFDIGASAVTSIHYLAYNDLMVLLGKGHAAHDKHQTEFMDIVQSIVQVDEAFVNDFKVDARGLTPGSFKERWDDHVQRKGDEDVMTDRFGGKWFRPLSGFYFDQLPDSFPMAGFKSEVEVEDFDWPELINQETLSELRDSLQSLGKDYALLAGEPIGGVFNTGFKLRGYSTFYLDLAGDVKMARCILDKIAEIKMRYWEKVLREAGDLIDIVVLEDDLGHQETLMISPLMYRNIIKPYHQRLVSHVKHIAPGHIKIMLHSCGSIYRLIPDLIEVGFDILNPIQTTAAEMNTAVLKREFGSDLVFWGGGIDIQKVLPFGTLSEVEYEVEKRINDLAPGGGFVFAATHNIQPHTPPQNIMKMWEVFQKNCSY
jgi:uroporphyrinogen decarboxylase